MFHVFCTFLLIAEAPGNDANAALLKELRRFRVTTALLVSSQAIDEHPVWSPDGRQLALNLDEKWSAIAIRPLKLETTTWHSGETIAVVAPPPKMVPVSEAEILAWEQKSRSDPRKVTTTSGATIELAEEELGTVFKITNAGSQPVIRWRTALENCHSLALSPDERLVAFICELNGLMVETIEP